ncbi:hypothetical protein KEM52_006213 [Ascosphaera acerosa]|nr:hypothetical protein KEM52_006213 [Ascosphaera acerosa]
MSNPQGAKSSKWGAFLQQAVAGVESRLDTILANEEDVKTTQAKTDNSELPGDSSPPARTPSRSTSTRGHNDRLQERLAKAIARKGSPASMTSKSGPDRTSDTEKRASSDVSSARPSEDSARPSSDGASHRPEVPSASGKDVANGFAAGPTVEARDATSLADEVPGAGDVHYEADAEPTPVITTSSANPQHSSERTQATVSTSDQSPGSTASAEYSGADARDYLEKIDALQAKIKYLTQQAAGCAQEAASAAASGSLQKKVLEKDEQIANLMAEGNKLARTEMENRATIKKLRAALTEKSRMQKQLQDKVDWLEEALEDTREELTAARRTSSKNAAAVASAIDKEKDFRNVVSERDALLMTVRELQTQLSDAKLQAELAGQAAHAQSLEAEKKRAQAALDELNQLRTEKQLADAKHARQLQQLQGSLERERERARSLQLELDGERATNEQRLETLRSRAEEASSSAGGDAQAKLLRQIETLQTQYAVASENWQRIEGSLVARLSAVEKERDEFEKLEADTRKKLRDAVLRAKRNDTELETALTDRHESQCALDDAKQALQKSQRELEETRRQLANAQEDVLNQKQLAQEELAQALEEEKVKWESSLSRYQEAVQAPPVMPQSDIRKLLPSEQNGLGSSGSRPLSVESPAAGLLNGLALGTARHISDTTTASLNRGRQSSGDTLSLTSATAMSMSRPMYADDYADDKRSIALDDVPATRGSCSNVHSRGVHDLMSTSTVGAGPSVQLVERMSAMVRRLESERAASKDELARLTAQRDEARQEVVELMREVEEKRKCDRRITELSAHAEDLERRYNTTLELLGEKSEQVDELQADVAELKRIYRDLVDSTMK